MTFEDVRFITYGLISIALGIIYIMQRKQNKRVKRIQDQVENNHVDELGNPINMREEQDVRHEENTNSLKIIMLKQDRINEKIDRTNEKIDHVNRKVDTLFSRVGINNGRIDDLEDTLDLRKGKKND